MTPEALTVDVQVSFMGDLPSVVGRRDMTVTLPQDNTVGDLLASLSESFGTAFTHRVFSGPDKLEHTILVFVNGQNIKEHGGFAARLGDGDVEVVMLPMFGGG
jgi:molybdopterin converting factor small subunit